MRKELCFLTTREIQNTVFWKGIQNAIKSNFKLLRFVTEKVIYCSDNLHLSIYNHMAIIKWSYNKQLLVGKVTLVEDISEVFNNSQGVWFQFMWADALVHYIL